MSASTSVTTSPVKETSTQELFGPGFESIPKAGYQAGQILKDEAIVHLQNRNWKAAIQVAHAAQQLRANDVDLYAIIAVSAAYSHKNGVAEDAIRDLRHIVADKTKTDLERADGCIAIASVRLAQERYVEADKEARKALAFDPLYDGSWWCLTASYTGLGWFPEAEDCLPLAKEGSASTLNSPPEAERGYETAAKADDSTKNATMSFAEWQVGRSINTWAMDNCPTKIIAIVGVILFGPLGLALAASAPLLARELRVMRLDDHWKSLAEDAWRTEHRLRAKHAFVCLTMVALWVALIAISA